jgi:hypothetical protein
MLIGVENTGRLRRVSVGQQAARVMANVGSVHKPPPRPVRAGVRRPPASNELPQTIVTPSGRAYWFVR